MRSPLLAVLALVGCQTDLNDDPPAQVDDAALYRFGGCGEMKDYIADAWLETVVRARYGSWGWDRAMSDGSPVAADAGAESGGPTDFSETNNQEAGVDEPDIVKTDGTHVYVVQANRPELTIVKSWPVDDAAVVGRVAVEGYPYSMFLAGDRVAVFSYVWSQYRENGTADSPYRDGYATRITLIDVSDRSAPAIERVLDIEGYMSSARMIDSDLYVVTDTYAYIPQEVWELTWSEDLGLPVYDWEASDAVHEAQRAEARRILRPLVEAIVNDIDVDTLLPRQLTAAPGDPLKASPLLSCGDVYHPKGLSDPGVLAVSHLDLGDDDGELSASAVMANGWTVYASEDNLYVAQSSWWWWWGWGDLDLDTHIHKFALDGAQSRYKASGSVPGWLWSQFAMSEYDGHLRVATTDIDWWWGAGNNEGGNNVFVLDDGLDVVGSVTGFAPDEQIYSSRFLGDKGYVVTFRQIDPLFTFDLSDPKDPQLMGELEMPGFSSYLHPYGKDQLIGVGMDGDEDGNIRGLAINLFDVSDLTAPTRVDQLVVTSDDWSWSAALWDHHAFTLHRDVLSLPIYTWDWDERTGYWDGFSGMMSLAVSPTGLTDLGRVGHEDLVQDSECLYTWYEDVVGTCPDAYWYAGMRRSVVIEDNLFSISDYGIKVTDLNDPMVEHARVLFWPN